MNDDLLSLIKARLEKNAEFNYGILTADAYVKTLQRCVGSDLCYRFAATKSVSFNDVLTKAANTLTYCNPEMVLEDLYGSKDYKDFADLNHIELPKNTLMVFKHTLTTDSKDRDGDTLRTKGAKVDPNMLLLWQHTHTLPIGKALGVAEHTPNRLKMYSAVVDINELSHDSAVMIENKMGRYSHGFKALDFEENKDSNGKKVGGFDIKSFEVMEESLVSVPANVDAETEEVILSLVAGGKLTSHIMKGYGDNLKEKRPTSISMGGHTIPLKIDLQLSLNGKAVGEEHEQSTKTKCNGKADCDCGCSGTPAKEHDHTRDGKETTDDKEVKTEGKTVEDIDEKSGRVLNANNFANLTKARDHLASIMGEEFLMTRPGQSKCKEAHALVDGVVKSAVPVTPMPDMMTVSASDVAVKDAKAAFISKASYTERKELIEILSGLNKIEDRQKKTEQFKSFTGQNNDTP